jgi:hypothetical protein
MADPLVVPIDYAVPDVSQLVTENIAPVENFAVAKQQRLLVSSLYTSLPGQTFLAEANVGIYHTIGQPAIVPDAFVSFDVQVPDNWWEKQHRCYLVWMFGKPPEIAIEVVADCTGEELGRKLEIYQQMRVSYYVVYDPSQQLGEAKLRIYELRARRYVELTEPWLEQVSLGLMLWQGEFEERQDTWLRWCDRNGKIYPIGDERADQAEQQLTQTEQQLLKAEQRAVRAESALAQEQQRTTQFQQAAIVQLRSVGLDPAKIAATLQLSVQQVEQLSPHS